MSCPRLPFALRPLALLAASLVCVPAIAQQTSTAAPAAHTASSAQKAADEAAKTSSSAHAQTLQPVTVVERVESQPTRDAQSLARQQPETLRDALDETAGVNFIANTRDVLGDIEIRGMGGVSDTMGVGASRVNMEIDGVELTQSFAFGHDMRYGREYFDPADLKSVHVEKGPGANGLAGNVQLRTKDPHDYLLAGRSWGGDIRMGGRTDESSRSAGASLAARMGDDLSASVSLTRRQYHELKNEDGVVGTSAATYTANEPLSVSSNAVNAKLVWSPDASSRLTASLQHFRADRDHNLARSLTSVVRVNKEQIENTRNALILRYETAHVTALYDTADYQLSHQRTDNVKRIYNKSVRGATTTENRNTNNYAAQTTTLRADFGKRIGSTDADGIRHDLSYGLRISRSKMDLDNTRIPIVNGRPLVRELEFFPITTSSQVRLHVADRISLGRTGLSFTPSLHIQRLGVDPAPDGSADISRLARKYSKTIAGGGLRADWVIAPAHTLSLVFNSAMRLPGFGETGALSYGHWPAEPNPNLKPERSRALELAWSSRGDWGRQKTTLFHNSYTDLIDVDCGDYSPGNVCKTTNTEGRSKTHGIEWEGALQLAALGAAKGLEARGGFEWARGKESDGKPLQKINPAHGWLALSFDDPAGKWGVQTKLRFAMRKKAKDLRPNTPELPGWGVVDFTFHVEPVQNLIVRGGIYNVLDRKYYQWSRARGASTNLPRYTEAGRNIGLNVQYKF